MIKTLAQLKRDMQKGTKVTLTACAYATHKFMNVERYVVKVQGNGVYLNEDKDATSGSFMDFPSKATLTEYIDDTFTIYEAGKRELTPEERTVLDSRPSKRPSNEKQCEIDIMSDGSQMFYADKRHMRENNMEHLNGFETVRGLRYDFNTGLIDDEKIKGKMVLQYKIN